MRNSTWLSLIVLCGTAAAASAQSSSLYGDPKNRQPLTLSVASFTYQPPPEPRQFHLHDQITVRVVEKMAVKSQGQIDRQKKDNLNAGLKDWVLFQGLYMFPDPQSKGDPKLSGYWENKERSQSNLDTRDSLSFNIATRIVDKRPNGLLVLEGSRIVHINNDTWEQGLSGIVRPEDVLPNNTVLSENVAELRIFKRESGHVRDGYRRGWLLELMDRYQPF